MSVLAIKQKPAKKRILLVDDSPLVHQMYGEELQRADYDVWHAQDGLEALKAVFSNPPDVVVLDIHMPNINGYQVCRLLKEHPATKHIPVIVFTGERSLTTTVADPKNWSFKIGAKEKFGLNQGGMGEPHL